MAKEKKLAMISQPMNGLTDEEILKAKERVSEKANALGYEVLDTFFADEYKNKDQLKGIKNVSVAFLAKSIEAMSHVDCVIFAYDWEENRGCRIEHAVAEEYGIEILYE